MKISTRNMQLRILILSSPLISVFAHASGYDDCVEVRITITSARAKDLLNYVRDYKKSIYKLDVDQESQRMLAANISAMGARLVVAKSQDKDTGALDGQISSERVYLA